MAKKIKEQLVEYIEPKLIFITVSSIERFLKVWPVPWVFKSDYKKFK